MAVNIRQRGDTGFYWTLTLLFWLALIFAVVPDGFNWVREGADVDAQGGSIIRRLQWLPLFVLAAYVIWIRRDVSLGMVRYINPFLLAFMLWVLLSMTWSHYPSVTLRKVVLLVGVGTIGLALQVASWQPRRLLRMLRAAVTVLLVVSLLMVLLFPGLALLGPPDNAWVGVTANKNSFGQLAGLGVLLWLHAWAARDASLPKALLGTAYCSTVLLLSNSASSLVCTVILVPVIWLLLRPPLTATRGWTVAILATIVVFLPLAYAYLLIAGVPTLADLVSPVASSVGRDVTLTGRLEIWQLVMQEIAKHPWLGVGYGAFWLGADGPAPLVTQNLYGILWQAHNGYLDVLNETGIVGMALVAGFLLFHFWQLMALLTHDRANAVLHAMFIIFFLVNNLSESSLFRPMDFLFFLSIITSLSLSRAHADIGLRRHPPRREAIVAAPRPRAEIRD